MKRHEHDVTERYCKLADSKVSLALYEKDQARRVADLSVSQAQVALKQAAEATEKMKQKEKEKESLREAMEIARMHTEDLLSRFASLPATRSTKYHHLCGTCELEAPPMPPYKQGG
jgi:hypothetical protein